MLVASKPSSRRGFGEVGVEKDRQRLLHLLGLAEALGHCGEDHLHRLARGVGCAADLKRGEIERCPPRLSPEGPLHGTVDGGHIHIGKGTTGHGPPAVRAA